MNNARVRVWRASVPFLEFTSFVLQSQAPGKLQLEKPYFELT